MIRKIIPLLICVIFSVGVILAVFGYHSWMINRQGKYVSNRVDQKTHFITDYDDVAFRKGVEQAEREDNTFASHVSGGIIPHHFFASYLIADFFNGLKKQNPQVIILIGPNHSERGNYKVLSGLYAWGTPFGAVQPDEAVIQNLLDAKVVEIDDGAISGDQTITAIMPFVKYYLPNAKVVPLLLSGFMTKEDAVILSEALSELVSDTIVIVASVDFSHYLTSPNAKVKDSVTLDLIKEFNYDRLLFLNSEYLDSPPSIVTLLMTMEYIDSTEIKILHHTDSGEMQKDDSIETTSYYSIVFYKS